MKGTTVFVIALGGLLALLGLLASGRPTQAAAALAATPTSSPTITATVGYTVTAVRNANLRSGPGTTFAVVGGVKAGASLIVTGTNDAGDWLQLANDAWIAAFLVEGVPTAAPTAAGTVAATATRAPTKAGTTPTPTAAATKAATPTSAPATPTSPPPTPVPATATSAPASGCSGGCMEQPPGCDIKGNVNSEGERIYHTLSSNSYSKTKVKLEEGDRWFCTEAEAQAAGFRAPRN